MIRQWKESDSLVLRPLVKAFLESQQEKGGSVAATDFNIGYYVYLGFDQIKANNDAHLVYEKNGEIVAYIQMGEVFGALERSKKTAEIFALYTKKEFEGQFFSIELVRAAVPYILANGYKKIISSVLLNNYRMWQNMFYNPAIWPTRIFLEWDLDADPQFQGEEIKLLERKKA